MRCVRIMARALVPWFVNEDRLPAIRQHPGEARQGSPPAHRSAGMRMAELQRSGHAPRPQGTPARERALAVLPWSRASIQSLVQLLRRYERGRHRQIPEGCDHRSPPDLEDGHERWAAVGALAFGALASGYGGR